MLERWFDGGTPFKFIVKFPKIQKMISKSIPNGTKILTILQFEVLNYVKASNLKKRVLKDFGPNINSKCKIISILIF